MDKPTFQSRDAVCLQEELEAFRQYMHECRLSHPSDSVTSLPILSKENASRMLEVRILNRFGNEEAYQRAIQAKDRMTFRCFLGIPVCGSAEV